MKGEKAKLGSGGHLELNIKLKRLYTTISQSQENGMSSANSWVAYINDPFYHRARYQNRGWGDSSVGKVLNLQA